MTIAQSTEAGHKLRLFFACAFLLPIPVFAQCISTDTLALRGGSPIRSQAVYSDSACSSFLLEIDREVKAHYHRAHTEHIVVLSGSATMRLGDKRMTVKAGDVIFIPKGTVHAVEVVGEVPLKVLSIQAPFFNGQDRVWVTE
jgi:mannose-6-phosphate isomerase-like protein (cupin superfamily)